jgi:hypothetical protein
MRLLMIFSSQQLPLLSVDEDRCVRSLRRVVPRRFESRAEEMAAIDLVGVAGVGSVNNGLNMGDVFGFGSFMCIEGIATVGVSLFDTQFGFGDIIDRESVEASSKASTTSSRIGMTRIPSIVAKEDKWSCPPHLRGNQTKL